MHFVDPTIGWQTVPDLRPDSRESTRQGLSTRKLLSESAKHTGLTAYSLEEGANMFHRFPKVDIVGIDGSLNDGGCSALAKTSKSQNPQIRIVAFLPRVAALWSWDDATTDSHGPAGLLKRFEEMRKNIASL